MSRVYFHSPSGEVELLGSERAWADCLTRDVAMAALPRFQGWERYAPFVPLDSYLHQPGGFDKEGSFKIWWAGGLSGSYLEIPGEGRLGTWVLSLNTAIALGGDALVLLARLHAQCEIHGYVEGPNRAWLAGVIEAGRRDNIMRPNMGWEAVVELLRSRDDEPVVTSYSVCDSFPGPHQADFDMGEEEDHDARWEAWAALPYEEQWERAMRTLRQQPGHLEWEPEGWREQGFGNGWSIFDLEAWISEHTPEPS